MNEVITNMINNGVVFTFQSMQAFIDICDQWSGITPEQVKILKEGSNEFWDTWLHVVEHASSTDENGRVFKIWTGSDGEIISYCPAEMTEQEKQFLFNFF